jgi:antitoxin (DNA-binding transcriptional repressor) of toxin-antitoxin stability system
MTTITAKELRLNMDQIFSRSRKGEVFSVSYRNKPAVVIGPDRSNVGAVEPGSAQAMQEAVAIAQSIAKTGSTMRDSKSFEDLYQDMLDSEAKYANR